MNIEYFREYCLSKKGVTEGFPFDNKVLVFKVMGKMFALCNIEGFSSINLKCEPEKAIALREQYAAVQPGYHMSKTHWNTVMVNEDVPGNLLLQMIDDSYTIIVEKLPKKLKTELSSL